MILTNDKQVCFVEYLVSPLLNSNNLLIRYSLFLSVFLMKMVVMLDSVVTNCVYFSPHTTMAVITHFLLLSRHVPFIY